MITITVEAILGVLLVLVLMNLFKKRPAAPAPPQQDLANLKASDARTGDVISVAGVGDGMTDLDFTADRTIWYQAGSRSWFEVSGHYRERRVSMRVVSDEDLEVSLHYDPRKITLEDVGLSEDDLAQMDERQNTGDTFEFDGKVWQYQTSREAQAKRDDQPQPTTFYYWEFRQQDGKSMLAIRKPEGEPFGVTLFTDIPPGDVTVYRGGPRP